jgi:hypothetical protein
LERKGVDTRILDVKNMDLNYLAVDDEKMILESGSLDWDQLRNGSSISFIIDEPQVMKKTDPIFTAYWPISAVDQAEKEITVSQKNINFKDNKSKILFDVISNRAKYGVRIHLEAEKFTGIGPAQYEDKINKKLEDIVNLDPANPEDKEKIVKTFDQTCNEKKSLELHTSLKKALEKLPKGQKLFTVEHREAIEGEYIIVDGEIIPVNKFYSF